MPRLLWVLTGLLLIGVWVFSAIVYPQLPERIPAHFGGYGQVTRMDSRESFWFLPALVTFLVAAGFGLSRLVFAHPKLLNLPQKEKFLELPPPKQRRVLARLDAWIALLYGLLVLAFGYLQWTSYRVATGQQAGLPVEVWIFPLAVLALIGWMVWDIGRTVRQETSSSQR
ncbi:DUF1648 domain-containing protein [Allomeiothermus silvanus]|uniref:DUF1648 domain-containing protein n=1 Tax=Allomeiothermus silvanus TaxID=52022 RepID=UPI0023F2AE8C|nr:DUF1648 domain-containing protein [Allomeiothermus silvanus]